MRLKVLVPDRVLIDQEVSRIVAWDRNGSFCLLPRHIDFVSALSPGMLSFEVADEYAEFLAIDEGVLVKQGHEVLVATRKAISESELEGLKRSLREKIMAREEEELRARAVIANIGTDCIESYVGRKGDD